MLDFLRMLAPQHTEALRPASALRRPATSDAAPSDASQIRVDDASQTSGRNTSQISLSRAAQPSRDAGPVSMADHPMLTTSDSVAPQRRQRAALTSAEIEAGSSARSAAMPASEMATPHSDPTETVEPSPAPHAVTRRRTATSLAADSPFQPADSPPQSHRSEPMSVRADRPAKRDHTMAASLPPLSPTAVALYAAPSSERDAGPAIHVTIDRIEVRAPAKDNRSAPSKRRDAAATQTLGDYLRGNSKVTQ